MRFQMLTRSIVPTTGDNVSASLSGAGLEVGRGISMARPGGVSVNLPS